MLSGSGGWERFRLISGFTHLLLVTTSTESVVVNLGINLFVVYRSGQLLQCSSVAAEPVGCLYRGGLFIQLKLHKWSPWGHNQLAVIQR